MIDLKDAKVGTRIWFIGEKRPYRVRARSERYLVCAKPMNLLRINGEHVQRHPHDDHGTRQTDRIRNLELQIEALKAGPSVSRFA